MRSFRLLCYLPAWGDGHAIDNIIDEYTHIFNPNVPKEYRCSHMELWFPDENQAYQNTYNEWLGMCHTSTMRGNENGVVLRLASTVLTHPERWYYYEIPVSDDEFFKLFNYCQARAKLGIKYGLITFLRFFTPRWTYNPNHPICSGECWYDMKECLDPLLNKDLMAALNGVNTPSPTRLSWRVHFAGFEMKNLV
jgi:hypothetical protein